MVSVRLSVPADAQPLAKHLRAGDRAEIAAYGGNLDPVRAIETSIRSSYLCWTFEVDDQVACVLGVSAVSALGGIGCPWMLGTDAVPRHRRILTQLAPGYIRRMLAAFPHLVNHVHAGNTTSVRWLRRLGFTVHPPVPFGTAGELFHPFELRG